MKSIVSEESWSKVLAALAAGATVEVACAAGGVTPHVASTRCKRDRAFAKAWDAALETGTDLIEEEMRRRIREGIVMTEYRNSKKVRPVRELSDISLMMMLRSRRPESFRELFGLMFPPRSRR
jgi:hypothetical protein